MHRSPWDFEFVIPSTNYQLDNLVFNGSGQNVTLTQVPTDTGAVIVITGTVPAYQSVGGQQPNGFNGQLTPTSDQPYITC